MSRSEAEGDADAEDEERHEWSHGDSYLESFPFESVAASVTEESGQTEISSQRMSVRSNDFWRSACASMLRTSPM